MQFLVQHEMETIVKHYDCKGVLVGMDQVHSKCCYDCVSEHLDYVTPLGLYKPCVHGTIPHLKMAFIPKRRPEPTAEFGWSFQYVSELINWTREETAWREYYYYYYYIETLHIVCLSKVV